MMQLSLLNTKPPRQVFACLVPTNQTPRMDVVENRRARLRQWFEGKTLPPKEKSYLSQLMTGKGSFGEKAARRLEDTYGMGDGFLDRPVSDVVRDQSEVYSPSSPKNDGTKIPNGELSQGEAFFKDRASKYDLSSPRYQKAADKVLDLPEKALDRLEPILDDLHKLYDQG